jgi:hypothetical protein
MHIPRAMCTWKAYVILKALAPHLQNEEKVFTLQGYYEY